MLRPFNPNDLEYCIEIVNTVWKITDVFKPLNLAKLFLKVYAEGSLSASNYAIVVEENNKVVGFLFGRKKLGKNFRTRYSGLTGKLRFLLSILSIGGVKFTDKKALISKLIQHEENRLTVVPKREFEVNLFAVSPNIQGKDYGRKLMESYVDICKKEGVEAITLDTDEDCDYKFYESFGFKKVADFFSPIQKLYTGKSGLSFVYKLEPQKTGN